MSKIKTIYILRHGQTDFNKKGMVQGRGINSSLNDTGRYQAGKVFEVLKEVGLDHIYTSSLNRSKETVVQFDVPKTVLSSFDEISWGDMEGVIPSEEGLNKYALALEEWRRGNLDVNVDGGESPKEVMDRQKEAMKVVLESPYTNVLICMHGRAMRILLTWLLNYPLEAMDNFEHSNCCYYKLIYTGSNFRVEAFNETSHLQ